MSKRQRTLSPPQEPMSLSTEDRGDPVRKHKKTHSAEPETSQSSTASEASSSKQVKHFLLII